MYVHDRRSRIEKRYHKKKRGKRAKPVGGFSHNVSLHALRDQQEEFIAETCEKEHKRQIHSIFSMLLREIENLEADWRENKEAIFDGVTKKVQFKKWLEHTAKDKDYLSMDMDTQYSEMTQLLNEKTDGFIIDTQLPPKVRESIGQVDYAPKSLNAVDWTALARNDDTVTFDLGPQLIDDDGDEEDEADEEDNLRMIDLLQLR